MITFFLHLTHSITRIATHPHPSHSTSRPSPISWLAARSAPGIVIPPRVDLKSP
jgi:hypothetical protein